MKTIPKLVLLGLMLGMGLVVLANEPSGVPKTTHFLVRTSADGRPTLEVDKENARRPGYVYIGFPIQAQTLALKSAADAGSLSAATSTARRPVDAGVLDYCVGTNCLPRDAVVVCQPATCNPPGKDKEIGDPPPDERLLNLVVWTHEQMLHLAVRR